MRIKRYNRRVLAAGVLFVAVVLTAAGCGTAAKKPVPKKPVVQNPSAAVREAPATQRVVLYFADSSAQQLNQEPRIITVQPQELPAAVIRELIRGPQVSGSQATIPAQTRLKSITVNNKTAYVDFTKELITKHKGSEQAEKLTIYSIVNSLAGLSGIERVQFVIEGRRVSSPLGNVELSKPLAPDYGLVVKPITQVQRIKVYEKVPVPAAPEKSQANTPVPETSQSKQPQQQNRPAQEQPAGQSQDTGKQQNNQTKTETPKKSNDSAAPWWSQPDLQQ